MHIDLDGQVALVTGSATGLGHACAEAFSRCGANVALASANLDDLAYASDRLHALGEGEIFALEVDVRDPANVRAFVEETVEHYGGIDHLVTGPRPLEPEAFLAVSDEDWFRAFDRSLMSVVWTVREAYPALEASDHGTVVNVTSPAIPALAGELAVATSFRRAVEGLTQHQARAFAPDVRVNSVVPGPHEVADLESLLAELVDADAFETMEDAWTAMLAGSALETPGDPLQFGTVVAFLASEHAGFVTGATLPVTGGAPLQ